MDNSNHNSNQNSNHNSSTTRVAIYIRIGGTGDHSSGYEKQRRHFSELLLKNPDWTLTDIYADLGTDSRKQPNLHRLLADCRAGRIDLITTKSTSRISRNMSAVILIVRELARLKQPVGIFFEDHRLNTLSKDSIVILSLFQALQLYEKESKRERMPPLDTLFPGGPFGRGARKEDADDE